jgi:hypothetical protein
MLPSHRNAHLRIWTILAILLPLVLLTAALLKPVALEKDPVRLDTPGAAAGK